MANSPQPPHNIPQPLHNIHSNHRLPPNPWHKHHHHLPSHQTHGTNTTSISHPTNSGNFTEKMTQMHTDYRRDSVEKLTESFSEKPKSPPTQTPPNPQNPQHHQHKSPLATHIHGKVAPPPRSIAILFCLQPRPRWINQRKVRNPSQGGRRWPKAVDVADLDVVATITGCGEREERIVREREEKKCYFR